MDIKIEPVEEEDNEMKYTSNEIFFDPPAQLSEPAEDFQEIMLSIKSEDVSKHLIIKEEAAVGFCMVKSEDSQYGVESSSSENVREYKFQSSQLATLKIEPPPSTSFATHLPLPCHQIDMTKQTIKNEIIKKECVAVIGIERRTFHKQNFACGVCFEIFESELLLKYHSISHSSNFNVKPHKCDNCAYQTSSSSHLKRHKMKHLLQKPFECDQCSFKTSDSSSLKRHQLIHSGQKPFKCDQCSFETTRSSHLKRHQIIHSPKTLLQCDQCSFETSMLSFLKRHQVIHSGIKPFKCDQCSFETARSSHLKRHQITHSAQKLLKCDQCEFETAHLYSLQRHQVIHSGEKPFKCDQCSFETVQSSSLKRHRVIHLSPQTFKCDQCSFETGHLSSLKKHQVTHPAE